MGHKRKTTAKVHFWVPHEELSNWRNLVATENKTLSAWIRQTLNDAYQGYVKRRAEVYDGHQDDVPI